METRTLFAGSESTKNIQCDLRKLAESITQIVQGIKQAQEPLTESRKTVPQATEQLERVSRQTEDAAHRVLDMVEAITSREGTIDAQLKELRRALPATYFRNNSKVKRIIEQVRACAESNQNDAYAIMDALQFQDITTQQIAHAIHMLEMVETRLHDVLMDLDGADRSEEREGSKRKLAFDPNASFSTDANRQNSVDELVDNMNRERGKK